MNRRAVIKSGIIGFIGLLIPIPTKAIAEVSKKYYSGPKRTIFKFISDPNKDIILWEDFKIIDFMDLKENDVFLISEVSKPTGKWIRNKKGGLSHIAISDPYLKDFGNGLTGTIESEPYEPY